MKKLLMTCVSLLPFLSAGTASAYLTNDGRLEILKPETLSAIYRSFRNPSGPMEISLGYSSLRTGADRTQGHVKYWGYGEAINTVTLTYLPEEDRLLTTVVSPVSGAQRVVFDRLSSSFADPNILNNLNYLQIGVAAQDAGVTVALADVYLNGQHLGDFTAPADGSLNWYLAGYDLSKGFTLTGKIILNELNGRFSNRDDSRIQILVGATPIPVPATVWLFGSGLAGLLALRRRRRVHLR